MVDSARRAPASGRAASLVIEDEELAPARHVADDALADEGVDEVAAQAPELEVRANREPSGTDEAVSECSHVSGSRSVGASWT